MTVTSWDELTSLASPIRAADWFDEEERDYKLEIAGTVKSALEVARDGGDWMRRLEESFRDSGYNLTNWRQNQWLLNWGEKSEELGETLAGFLGDSGPVARFDRFAQLARAESVEKGNAASVLAFGSLFNFAKEPESLPMIRARVFESVERSVGWDAASSASPTVRYENHLAFAHQARERMEAAGVPIRDMVDVQGVVFVLSRQSGDQLQSLAERGHDAAVKAWETRRGTAEPGNGGADSESSTDVSRAAVVAAITEFDQLGRDAFLEKYGFGQARKYVLLYGGNKYDSKAIYGVAYGIDHAENGPLRPDDFTGGEYSVLRKLRRIGFDVRDEYSPPDVRAWIVRAGREGRYEGLALEEGVALIGWSELGPLTSSVSRDELKRRVEETYAEARPQAVAVQAGQIYRFVGEIKNGDLVVLPRLARPRHVAVGRVSGEYQFRDDGPFAETDAKHTRAVDWVAPDVPYGNFAKDLQTAFGQQGTVSEIGRTQAAERILAGVSGESDPTPRRVSTHVWWVNQGSSLNRARAGGYLWAPQLDKAGRTKGHWEALKDARVGDLILNFASGSIRGVSRVLAEAAEAPRPDPAADARWSEDGWLMRIDYQDLSEPLPLTDIPEAWRRAEKGPFTVVGGAKQGYFFPVSAEFAGQLAARFPQLGLHPTSGPVISSYEQPSFADIVDFITGEGMSLQTRLLRRYHLSLKTRGFVILSGISGSGKTWLAELYAEALGAAHLLVAVAPNWTTNEDLLGYLNPLSGEYQHTPFSLFLREAAEEYEAATRQSRTPTPFHLTLDEMNLARVEYYFARFLSAMEVRARNDTAAIELAPGHEVLLTPNLYFTGTVNVDETTHGFADKVYDRAQLLELVVDRNELLAHMDDAPYADGVMAVWDAVEPIAPFAFRVLDEIAAYVDEASELDVPWEDAVDEQLLQKVLPKLKGADLRLEQVLADLIEASASFPLSREKASTMLQTFKQHGFTSFF